MSSSDENNKPPRSPAFTQEELVFLVKFLDKKKYDAPLLRTSYKRKTAILEKLSKKFYATFGTIHTPRQLQKRFSDMKVRQKITLDKIRMEIAKDSATSESAENNVTNGIDNNDVLTSENHPTQDYDAELLATSVSALDTNLTGLSTETEDEYVTLTLEPLETPLASRSNAAVAQPQKHFPSYCEEIQELLEGWRKIKEKLDYLLAKVETIQQDNCA